jgi:signal transduction histidine kinase/CheY-like chemotaxis protein/PAS domain-containing protein
MVLVDTDLHHYCRNDLGMFNLLRHPVWVFDIDNKAMYWANKSALYVWNADSLEELLLRDFATDMSDAAWSFLLDTKRKITKNEDVTEQWTFYPEGLGATTTDITCSAIRIDNGRIAMLVEAEIFENKRVMAESTVRSIEILKHLPMAVSQFTIEGKLIYQNPHALQIFGSSSSLSSSFSSSMETPSSQATEQGDPQSKNGNCFSEPSSSVLPPQATKLSVSHSDHREDDPAESDDETPLTPPMMKPTSEPSHHHLVCDMDQPSPPKHHHHRHYQQPNIILQRFVDVELGKTALQHIQEGIDFNAEAQLYTQSTPTATNTSVSSSNTSSSSCTSLDCNHCSSSQSNTYTQQQQPLQQKWFNVLLRRTRDPVTSEYAILYIARDISDIVKARKETSQAALKSEFLDVMAHEIRTPLHQIVGHVDLLEDSILSKEQLESVQQIQSSSSLLMSIINDLLDCSKLEYGQVQVENVTFALDGVVQGCIAAIRPQTQKKGIGLSCHVHSSCAPYLISDPNRLRQVLHNLLSNAVKFTDTGSVTLTVMPYTTNTATEAVDMQTDSSSTTDVSTGSDKNSGANKQDQQRLRFEVTDTGMGISVSEQTVVFERYRQANSSVARKFGGTGLGLPICKGLVELMGGNIGLNSTAQKGTTVYFEIPFQVANFTEDISSSIAKRNLPSTNATAVAMDILVVEDNKVNQKVVQSMLQRLGHVVTLAENGQIALDELNRKQFHLILMDIQMPVMDGVECTKYIRNVLHLNKQQLPIVGLTAGFQHSEKAYYENDVGMNSCLGKPLPMGALKKAMESCQPKFFHVDTNMSLVNMTVG